MLFYNNGASGFANRNPYWLVPGWLSPSGGSIQWGEPEVGLYSVDASVSTSRGRPGYPDFIVVPPGQGPGQGSSDAGSSNGELYITETEKVHCRLHRVADDLLALLLDQRTLASAVETDIVAHIGSGSGSGSDSNTTAVNGLSSLAAGSVAKIPFSDGGFSNAASAGFAITARFLGPLTPLTSDNATQTQTQDIFSTQKRAADGLTPLGMRLSKDFVQETITLQIGHEGPTHLSIPFRFTLDQACTEWLTAPGPHFFAVSADPASLIVTAMVDGVLCDGGAGAAQGWAQLPRGEDNPLQFVAAGAAEGTVGPLSTGLHELRVYGRYLRTGEMLGNFRSGLQTAG